MSCQQVPRLTEDPYTFTETTSSAVTATLFNPQIHKLTPIISSTNQTNSKVITTRTQQQQQQQQQHHQQIVTTSNRLIQQHFNARINGITQISNGIHKNVITTNQQTLAGGTTTTTNQKFLQNQQQQQLQLQYQQFQQVGKITVNNTIGTTTKKFLPSQSPTTITVHQSHPLYSLAKQNSILTSGISQQQQQQQQSISSSSLPIVTTTVTTNIPLPPLFQRNIISRLPLASSSSSLPSSVSSAILTTGISGIVTQQQQQQQQQKTNIIPQPLNRIAQKNHSNQIIQKTSSVVSGIRNIPSQHQQIHGYNVVSTNFGTSQLNTIGLSGINGSIRNNNSINNNNSNIGNVNNVLNNNNNINNNNNSNIRKHSINPTIVNPININQNSEIPTKRKTLETDSTIFVTPAKRDTKVSSSQTSAVVLTTTTTTSAGKKTLPTKTQSSLSLTSKRKRSYSQTTHHEALQRISGLTTLSSSSLSLPTQSGGGSTSINSNTIEWHAPDSYIFDSVSPTSSLSSLKKSENYDILSCIQSHWLKIADVITFIPTSSSITREQRIELRKVQLRRQAIQYASAQKFRTLLNARKRLICVSKALRKLRERDEIQTPRKCCFSTCTNESLALTAYCYLHITRNTDQYLFLPCTAKFSDNSQCRVPVFDISHELPLCREHAWKRDNYNRILQEQKPKKSPRKRPKPSAMTRPQKRNKKKRKPLMNSNNTMLTTTITNSILDDDNTNSGGGGGHHISGCADDDDDDDVTIDGGVINNVNCDVSMIGSLIKKIGYQMKSEKHDEINYIISAPQQTTLPTKIITQTGTTQDLLGICDNSSAYESSEDTGVGGLSESELIVGAHDVIEEIPLGDTRLLEEHDLTNVLNQLPVDAFNELFTTVQQNGPLEPTQEEQEDLERALEAVNKQVKSLQQMTGGGGGTGHDTAFLGDFLDVDDQILDDSDICTEVGLHSPNSNGELDTNSTILSDNNGTTRSNTRGNDLRGLVQT